MSIDLDDPVALMLAAAAALERSGGECAAYGGLALGMYGEPRVVIETQRTRLDGALIRSEIQRLIEEIPDHDICGRFGKLGGYLSQ